MTEFLLWERLLAAILRFHRLEDQMLNVKCEMKNAKCEMINDWPLAVAE